MNGDLIGPQIPAHILAKRKRKAQEQAAVVTTIAATAAKSPEETTLSSTIEDQDAKKRRVAGPAPPPASLDERPDGDPEDDSSSDDDIGPSLPPGPGTEADEELAAQRRLAMYEGTRLTTMKDDGKPKRDEWMLLPPKSEDWATKVDPTKLRNRKFNTGKGAKAPQGSATENTLWTESIAERQKRLDAEVMGLKRPATQAGDDLRSNKNTVEVEETARRIREYNEKHRAKSLYDEHKKLTTREKDDDPSARAFDREKDIAGGRRIGHKQKKEMLDRAAEFGTRFSSGNFL
ncbi:hypothetical protein RUND412_003510 [Rhizina undulata]